MQFLSGFSSLVKETFVVSLAYTLAFCATFKFLMPVQNSFFPEFQSHASLLFLPHGVRVLSAWLLGWRSVIALTPGAVLAFWWLAGAGMFTPSRLFALAIAVILPAAVFHAFRLAGWDLRPKEEARPCWGCIVLTGVVISVLTASLTNLAFGSTTHDYLAYLIGDFFGLFFLMAILMFAFRSLRKA
ncbi:hypothetical protein [Aliiroseovarius crassostreae]|uniref:hypothetical protein n=1 Tax=Aliiroseovarius crassostreae TaxID=154981 RepID=UPI00223B9577|nr:hypothetical protein [Aliiroseovarius crassostreae]